MNAQTDWDAVMARILSKIEVVSDCWLWTGSMDMHGYGRMAFRGRNYRAPKIAWCARNKAEWPEGKHALHSCDTRSCVNPDHIRPGTNAENIKEAWDRGGLRARRQENKRYCPRGHALTPDNLVSYPSIAHQSPRCRTCERARTKRQNEKRKSARLFNQATLGKCL